jgi:glyoxalase superfamily protein
MPSPTFQVTFDARDPARLAAFWRDALGYIDQPPPEGFETFDDFLWASGLEGRLGHFAALVDAEGSRPRIFFQRVPEEKSAKNRVHLDVNIVGRREVSRDERLRLLDSEAERLIALGATTVLRFEEPHEVWIVMTDPEGNEFCIQ